MAREQTRTLLLEVGRKTFLERGYTNSGLETILQTVGVPKGSFYHYFQSKEDFGLQVLDHFARVYDESMDQTFRDESLPPIVRFMKYFEEVADRFERDQCRNGCLVGTLSQEMANQNELFRAKLAEIFQRWNRRYTECLALALDGGEIQPILSLPDCVELWISGWQGAMLRAKTMQSSKPLRSFLAIVLVQVFRVRTSLLSGLGVASEAEMASARLAGPVT